MTNPLITILTDQTVECPHCSYTLDLEQLQHSFDVNPPPPEQAKLDLIMEIFDHVTEEDLLRLRDKYFTPDRPGIKR